MRKFFVLFILMLVTVAGMVGCAKKSPMQASLADGVNETIAPGESGIVFYPRKRP